MQKYVIVIDTVYIYICRYKGRTLFRSLPTVSHLRRGKLMGNTCAVTSQRVSCLTRGYQSYRSLQFRGTQMKMRTVNDKICNLRFSVFSTSSLLSRRIVSALMRRMSPIIVKHYQLYGSGTVVVRRQFLDYSERTSVTECGWRAQFGIPLGPSFHDRVGAESFACQSARR